MKWGLTRLSSNFSCLFVPFCGLLLTPSPHARVLWLRLCCPVNSPYTFRLVLFSLPLLTLLAPSLRAETPAPDQAATATQVTISFHSPSLGRDTDYIAVLPEPLDPGTRYPVLYLLHGAHGSYKDWTTNTSATLLMQGRRFIVVTPDGGQFGWYLDSDRVKDSRYESCITKDLIADVDGRFPTIAAREGRAIAGLSMGGHGALSLAAKYPNLFLSASSMSGILKLENHPNSWKLPDLLGALPDAAPAWKKHSVYHLAERFTSPPVALLFDTGMNDSLAVRDNEELHLRLSTLGFNHTFRLFPGEHNWAYWSARLPEHLQFHQHAFATAQNPPKPPERGGMWTLFQHHYTSRVANFRSDNNAHQSVVLLGDSITEGFDVTKHFPFRRVLNRGIGADVIGVAQEPDDKRGAWKRLNESVFDTGASHVFLMIGINDLGDKRSPEVIAQGYRQILSTIRSQAPRIVVHVQSLLPTSGNHAGRNADILEVNRRLSALATEFSYPYMDLHTLFKDEKGELRADLTHDGLHLLPAGYDIWKQRIDEEMQW